MTFRSVTIRKGTTCSGKIRNQAIRNETINNTATQQHSNLQRKYYSLNHLIFKPVTSTEPLKRRYQRAPTVRKDRVKLAQDKTQNLTR